MFGYRTFTVLSNLVMVKVDALEGVCWQVVIVGQRLKVKPVNLESVNRVARRGQGSSPTLVYRAQTSYLHHHPKTKQNYQFQPKLYKDFLF